MSIKEPDQQEELAIALYYDEKNAPRITAKGEGAIARQILAIAKEHNIPLEDDPELAALLAQIPLGDEIPEEFYLAIAEVIGFAYIIAGKFPPGYDYKAVND